MRDVTSKCLVCFPNSITERSQYWNTFRKIDFYYQNLKSAICNLKYWTLNLWVSVNLLSELFKYLIYFFFDDHWYTCHSLIDHFWCYYQHPSGLHYWVVNITFCWHYLFGSYAEILFAKYRWITKWSDFIIKLLLFRSSILKKSFSVFFSYDYKYSLDQNMRYTV